MQADRSERRPFYEVNNMEITELTNAELELAIYEAIHEMQDKKYRERLLKERERRNLNE